MIIFHSASRAWFIILERVVNRGAAVQPRGMNTLEVRHNSVAFDLTCPVIVAPPRKLSYRFMAAEALWILSGDKSVDGIAPYNKNIAQFSDDGLTFFGAYGPPIHDQIGYVVQSLLDDRDTRQAVLTIWRPNPPKSRDIPCTVSIAFNIRNGRLNAHVFMRSSDSWLGVPYDFFNFAMLAYRVGASYNERVDNPVDVVTPGSVFWTAVSSHLYERDFERAKEVLAWSRSEYAATPDNVAPAYLMTRGRSGYDDLVKSLTACRDRTDRALSDADALPWRIRP